MKFISAVLISIFIVAVAPVYAGDEVSLKAPPASLKEWYKPINKRQVWLHTMFKLRREMQAIGEYAKLNDQAAMAKWVVHLEKDYNKIGEMVPEWKKQIKPRLLSELARFAENGDSSRVAKTLKMIQRTCDDCHQEYQPLVTAMYRAPHYDEIKLKSNDGVEYSFEDNMEDLSESVNRILIALKDDHKERALKASKDLHNQLQDLGNSCNGCHKDDKYPYERILGMATQQRLKTLQSNITNSKVKDSQELMGEIAVTVCARCHNTHRIVNDLRNALLPDEY